MKINKIEVIESDSLEQIKATRKVERTFDYYFNHFILILPVSLVSIGFAILKAYFKYSTGTQLLLTSLVLISLGLLIGYVILKRLIENLTFESIYNVKNISLIELKQAIELNFKIAEISIDEKLGYIEVLTSWTAFSWGEKITVIQDDNKFLINSRPSGIRQPITIFKDKNNITKVRKILS